MKKFIIKALLLSFALCLFSGCSNNSDKKNLNVEDIKQIDFYLSEEGLIKKVNNTSIISITDEELIKEFHKMLDDAQKLNGILDATFNYIVEIKNENGVFETLYMNLEADIEESGLYVNSNDTSIGYEIDKEDLKELINTYRENLK